jgi:uncharacterized protein (TIGR00369 family)
MSGFIPQNPDYVAAVHAAFGRQPFIVHLGARIARVEPGAVELHLGYREEIGQNHGYFHGGVLGAIADTSAGFAGFSLMPAGGSVLTAEYKINIVAPGKGEELIGRGQVLSAGRTLIFTEARLYVRNGDRETLCAVALQTLRGKTGGPGVTF